MSEASWLLDAWVRDFRSVLEMMTGQACEVRWSPSSSPPEASFWWQQTFSIARKAPVWIGASASAWHDLGGYALKAAGVEEFERTEARNTFIEIVQQSLNGTATALGSKLGTTVELADGEVTENPKAAGFAATVTVVAGETMCELSAVVADEWSAVLKTPEPAQPSPAAPSLEAVSGSSVDFLLDVELPVSISFGNARLLLKDILKLTTGSVVELDQQPEEPVDVIVNNTVIARGEVVVVEGNYGVRISEIMNRQSRLALKLQDRPGQARATA